MDRHSVDREQRRCDRRERSGQAVHVVEQVEGVGHPDEPDETDRCCEHVVADDLDGDTCGEHDRGRAELDGELDDRRQRADVVDETGCEEQCCTAEDAEQLPVLVRHPAGGERGASAGK